MWLCEYCDAENCAENNLCKTCGKEKAQEVKIEENSVANKVKTAIITNAQNQDKYDLCFTSIKLKKWGKIFMFSCLVMGLTRFVANAILIFVFLPRNSWHGMWLESAVVTAILEVPSWVTLFVTTLTWIGGGILIKLALDALAIIVQSSHLNIKSKRGE